MKRVIIIGGGISGLSTALYLGEEAEQRGMDLEVTILEGGPRIGGNIRTVKERGFIIEGGPDCFLSEKPWAMELIKKLGLGEKLLPTRSENQKTFVLSRGRLHELPEGVILMVPTRIVPLLTSSLISFRGKIRMALELFVPRKRSKEDESLGDFVRRRLGKEALEKIAEPLVAGIHAGDPETMSIRSSFPRFVELEEKYGSLIRGMLARMRAMKKARKGAAPSKGKAKVTMFMTLRDGLGELIEVIEKRLRGFKNFFIRTGARVKNVERAEGGYKVHLEDGKTLECDAVVVATPAYAASEILKEIDFGLSKKLLTIPYVSTATVSIAFRKADVKDPLKGFGFVVPKIECRKIMAATWTSSKFLFRAPEDAVLIRCFVGGSKNEELVYLSEEEIASIVREELKSIMGIDADPVLVKVFRWNKAMPQYTIGHAEKVSWIEERTRLYPGLFLTGSAYRGIGISDCVRNGETTAKKVVEFLSGGQ